MTAGGGGSDDGGSGGGLPVTGAPTGQIAGVGLLLMLSGALALVLTGGGAPSAFLVAATAGGVGVRRHLPVPVIVASVRL